MIWYIWFVKRLLDSGNYNFELLHICLSFSLPFYSWILALVPRPIYISCNIRVGNCCNCSLCKYQFMSWLRVKIARIPMWGIMCAVNNPQCYMVILIRCSAFRFQLLAWMLMLRCSCQLWFFCTSPSTLINEFPIIVVSNRFPFVNRGQGSRGTMRFGMPSRAT